MKTERRSLPFGEAAVVEERDGQEPRIAGMAAVFFDGTRATEYEVFPGVFERISEGAFDKVLAEETDTRALLNHDPNMLLGRTAAGTMKLTKLKGGLRYTTTPQDTQVYRDTLTNIRNKNITGSSFAFTIEKESFEDREDGTIIRTIESIGRLLDVSPTVFPAYEGTTAGVRSEDTAEVRSRTDAWKAERDKKAAASVALAAYAERAEKVG